MTVWTDVVTELTEGSEDQSGDYLVYWDSEGLKSEADAPEDERRRNMVFSDPVHRINVKEYIKGHLQGAIANSGGEEKFQEWLGHVDHDVVKGFGALGVL